MTYPENLAKTQRWFWKFITARENVEKSKELLSQEEPESTPISSWIKANDEQIAVQRLDVYVDMYFYRLLDILAEDFERLVIAIGREAFFGLISDYLQAHPSPSYTLNDIGRALPPFLRDHLVDELSWLGDFAEIELTRHLVLGSPNHPTATAEELSSLPAEAWEDLRFEATPSIRFLHLKTPAHIPWNFIFEQGPDLEAEPEPIPDLPDVEPQDTTIVVWRHNDRASHYPIPPKEEQALKLLLDGLSFNEICAAFVPQQDDDDELSPEALQAIVQEAYQALSRWINHGMIVRLIT